MELDQIISNQPSSKQHDLLIFVIHELTVEIRGEDDVTKIRGLVEAIHTIASALLPGTHKDNLIGHILRDYGRIYGIDDNLDRVYKRVERVGIE